MLLREARAVAARLGIDDEVDLALAVQRHRFRAMAADGAKAHLLEERMQLRHIRRGVFDEFESVGADGIVPELGHPDLLGCNTIVSSETILKSSVEFSSLALAGRGQACREARRSARHYDR